MRVGAHYVSRVRAKCAGNCTISGRWAEIRGCSFIGLAAALLRGMGFLWLEAVDFAHAGEGAADVGNGDGAADDEGDVECVDHFFPAPAFFGAADEMVSDAVVA